MIFLPQKKKKQKNLMIFQLPTWDVGSWGSGLLSAYLLIKKWLSQLKSSCLIKKIKK